MLSFLFLAIGLLVLLASIRPMANLETNTPRTFRGRRETTTHEAEGELFAGAAVQRDASTGLLENATGTATTFVGIALEHARAAGARIEVADDCLVELPVVAKATNWALTDIGATIYVTDGNTYTLVSTSAQAVGKVAQIESGVGTTSARVWAAIQGVHKRSI